VVRGFLNSYPPRTDSFHNPDKISDTRDLNTQNLAPIKGERLWPLGIFFLLSAASAWTVWLWPLRQGWLTVILFGSKFRFPLVLVKLVIGNCLPGILAVVWTLGEGKDRFRGMVSTLMRWRTSLKWYVLAVALPCGVSLVALDVVLLYFPKAHSFPPAIDFLKVLLMTLPFGPLWEELAWRAFALRKLESRYSRLVSALLLGAYWAVWHIPLWLVQIKTSPVSKFSFLLPATIALIAWSVIWAYLYHRSSESLPVVILLHATYGAATTQAALVVPELDIYVIYASVVLSVWLAAAFAKSLCASGQDN
jgi:uncharacterized protein